MKFFSMAALALMGSVMTGCSSENDLAGNQQPAVKDNIVTVTTTIGLGGGDATTRALSATGVKTFAEGDQIALFYQKSGSSNQFKAVGTAENISADGKSATFTFELDNPQSNSDIVLSYPADFMDEVPNELNPAFAQDGTLNGGVKANDLGFAAGELAGTDLPASISLTNPFAVVAFTLKDGKGTDEKSDDVDVTSTITEMTIELPDYGDEYTYTITREAAAGPIYVVMSPISSAEINITATGGGKTYTKSYTKSYAASNFYQQGLLMAEPEPEVAGSYFTANSSGLKVAFSKGNLQATYNGSTWTWAFAEHQYDYIGNASGNTKVTDSYPFISENATVDLFGWVGASSTWDGVNRFGITSAGSDYLKMTDGYGNVADESMKAVWNSTNLTITNGGTYTWRTLTGGEGGEWEWIIGPTYDVDPGTNCRASGATVNGTPNARYTFATINTGVTEVNGIILFPDGCKINSSSATWGSFNTEDDSWGTKCTTAQWTHLEELGCVFLPAAGYREGAKVDEVGTHGYYWSSSPDSSDTDYAHFVYFGSNSVVDPGDYYERYKGYSVRLVREVEVP